MKKTFFVTVFLIAILVTTLSFASYSTVTMEVVEEPVCTIDISENSKFEKKLISKDLANKEVTLQLQVTNGEDYSKPTGEIILLIDNSLSMEEKISTEENAPSRKDVVFQSAQTLVTNLLQDNDKLKVGAVRFSSNEDVDKEASLEDASLVHELTNDATALNTAIAGIEANGPRTDLDAGLEVARSQFSNEENNKYLIILTDGVPNLAIGNNDYFSPEVVDTTKQKLSSISSSGINVITMLTTIDNEDGSPTNDDRTYKSIIDEIFGTEDNPNAGKFYYIDDNEIEKTITEDIYNDLLPVSKSLTNIKIVDYFPKEIIDNFDFAYVSNANIGEISAEVDKTNNSITWTIPELKSGETATVQYKLKLKENFDSSIVGKILDTNEKVDITYTDFDGNPGNKTSEVTPKLKLSEPPAELPKAGITGLVAVTALAVGILIFFGIKLKTLNKDIK